MKGIPTLKLVETPIPVKGKIVPFQKKGRATRNDRTELVPSRDAATNWSLFLMIVSFGAFAAALGAFILYPALSTLVGSSIGTWGPSGP